MFCWTPVFSRQSLPGLACERLYGYLGHLLYRSDIFLEMFGCRMRIEIGLAFPCLAEHEHIVMNGACEEVVRLASLVAFQGLGHEGFGVVDHFIALCDVCHLYKTIDSYHNYFFHVGLADSSIVNCGHFASCNLYVCKNRQKFRLLAP